jgi:hypothetical protein
MQEERPPYTFIRDALERGRVIPFLGAGASLVGRPPEGTWRKEDRAFLPRGAELAAHLANASQFPGEPSDLLAVAQYCDEAVGRSALKRELYAIFGSADFPLGSLHRYLATIEAPLVIVTTNYDDLIERALGKRPYHLVVHATDAEFGQQILWQRPGEPEAELVSPKNLDIDTSAETVVYKMHGTFFYRGQRRVDVGEDEVGQYVITEDDYVEFLTRLTKGKALPAGLAEAFEKRHFLFLGYSLKDWNLRVVLNRVQTKARELRDVRSWAIDEAPSSIEQAFWRRRGVRIYRQEIDAFVTDLQEA